MLGRNGVWKRSGARCRGLVALLVGDGSGWGSSGGYVLDDGRGVLGWVGPGDVEGVELGVELVAAVLPHEAP